MPAPTAREGAGNVVDELDGLDPASVTALLRAGRCHDCAFTAGTPANGHRPTQIKALLCVQGLEHFYCHVFQEPDGSKALCAGWLEAVRALAEKGGYREEDAWRRDVLRGLNDVLQAYADGLIGDSEAEITAAIRNTLFPERAPGAEEGQG